MIVVYYTVGRNPASAKYDIYISHGLQGLKNIPGGAGFLAYTDYSITSFIAHVQFSQLRLFRGHCHMHPLRASVSSLDSER